MRLLKPVCCVALQKLPSFGLGRLVRTWPTRSTRRPGTHTTKSTPYPINYQAMEPYNTLMFHTFGGGNNQFSWLFGADGTGLMADAWALGVRLDYAVASNLNVWGTYLWAERLERDGYLAGQFGGFIARTPFVRCNVRMWRQGRRLEIFVVEPIPLRAAGFSAGKPTPEWTGNFLRA